MGPSAGPSRQRNASRPPPRPTSPRSPLRAGGEGERWRERADRGCDRRPRAPRVRRRAARRPRSCASRARARGGRGTCAPRAARRRGRARAGPPARLIARPSCRSSATRSRTAAWPPARSYRSRRISMNAPAASATGTSGCCESAGGATSARIAMRRDRLHRALPERAAHEPRAQRRPAAARREREHERRGERVGREADVGVGEAEPLAARALGALRARPRLAEPARRRLAAVDRDDARVVGRRARDRRARAVARAVVDDDDLERGVALRAQQAQRLLDVALLVARRHHDRDRSAHRPERSRGRARRIALRPARLAA